MICHQAPASRHLRHVNVRRAIKLPGAAFRGRNCLPEQEKSLARQATPRCDPKTPLASSPGSRCQKRQTVACGRSNGQAPQPFVTSSQSFFPDSFKQALNQALERSVERSGEDASHVKSNNPQSSSLSTPKLPRPPSVQEDMLGAALEASRTTVSRLMAIKNEVDRAIDREKLQVERLGFAVDKAHKDEAYYRVLRFLRMVQERGASDIDG